MVKLVMKLVVMVVAEVVLMVVVVVVVGGKKRTTTTTINATTFTKITTKSTNKHTVELINLNQKCHPYNSRHHYHHYQYATITTNSPA